MSELIDPAGLKPKLDAGQIRVMRQSTLGTADVCLKRLEYYLDPSIPYVTGEARVVGTAYHAGLEHFYARSQTGTPTSAAREAFELEAEFVADWDGNPEAAWARVEGMLAAYFGGECYWPDEYEVVGTEVEFLLPAERPGWALKGAIDLVLLDPAGWYVIVDHKTAGKPWRKGKESARSTNQPDWYLHLWPRIAHALGLEQRPAAFVFDVMTYDGRFTRVPAPRTEATVAAIRAKANVVMALIECGGPYPPNTQSFLCDARWCDWWDRCPWGAAMDADAPPPSPVPVSVQQDTDTDKEQ